MRGWCRKVGMKNRSDNQVRCISVGSGDPAPAPHPFPWPSHTLAPPHTSTYPSPALPHPAPIPHPPTPCPAAPSNQVPVSETASSMRHAPACAHHTPLGQEAPSIRSCPSVRPLPGCCMCLYPRVVMQRLVGVWGRPGMGAWGVGACRRARAMCRAAREVIPLLLHAGSVNGLLLHAC